MIVKRSREGWFQSCTYRVEHAFQVFKNPTVFKADYANIQPIQEFITFLVFPASSNGQVFCSIQFHRNSKFWTIKVDSIRTYSVLTSKLFSIQLRLLKVLPEKCFSGRQIAAKVGTIFGSLPVVVNKTSAGHWGVSCM